MIKETKTDNIDTWNNFQFNVLFYLLQGIPKWESIILKIQLTPRLPLSNIGAHSLEPFTYE